MELTNISTGMSVLVNNEYIGFVTALVMLRKQQYMTGHTRHVPINHRYTLAWSQFLHSFHYCAKQFHGLFSYHKKNLIEALFWIFLKKIQNQLILVVSEGLSAP